MKHFLNLQLFAEDGGTGDQAPANTTEAPESKAQEQQPKTYTQAEVDKIVTERLKREQKKAAKAIDEAKKYEQLTAQEKAEADRDRYKQELETLQKQVATGEMMKAARKTLAEKGITIDDDLLSIIVSDDADKTTTTVNSFITSFQKAVDAAVKEALKGGTPHTKKGNENITKDAILAVKNRQERQKLIAQHRDLFVR